MTRARSLFTFLILATAACRGGGSGDDVGDDDVTPDGNVDPNDVSIYDIQGDLPVDGTSFAVRGVVVTAIDRYGERVGNIWVQEPDGGPYSGVLVYRIALGVVDDLNVGDVVDLEHVVKDEFALSEDTSGRTTTELGPPEGGQIVVTVVDSGDAPEPEVVDALAIGLLPTPEQRDAEWEKWEGVLISVESVTVIDELDQIGSTPQDPPFEEMRVTGPLRLDTSLASIDPVEFGECLTSVTGIGDYFFNYKLLPRETSAVVGGGAGCPAAESACDDTVDNDANGYADCDDNACAAAAGCSTEATVVGVQMGDPAPGSVVVLEDVVITGYKDFSTASRGFWVADAAQGAIYNGIFVLTGSSLPEGVEIGATADITGEVVEFDFCDPDPCTPSGDTLTEIDARDGIVTITAGAAVLSGLEGISASTLSDITAGEPYEGVLVTVGPGIVTAQPGNDRLTITTADGAIVADDDGSFNYASADYPVDTCFTSVTGVMTLNVFDNDRRLIPMAEADLVEDADGSDCAGL